MKPKAARHFFIQHCEIFFSNHLFMRNTLLAAIHQHFSLFLGQLSNVAGHIVMLLGVKIWLNVEVGIFLLVGDWKDNDCYPLRNVTLDNFYPLKSCVSKSY